MNETGGGKESDEDDDGRESDWSDSSMSELFEIRDGLGVVNVSFVGMFEAFGLTRGSALMVISGGCEAHCSHTLSVLSGRKSRHSGR